MAVITATDATGSGEKAVTVTTLGASDTFTFKPGGNQYLYLNNVTAGALTPNIIGTAPEDPQVVGAGAWDISAGYTTASIGAGATVVIRTSTLEKYCAGTGVVTITGGTAIEASLLEY